VRENKINTRALVEAGKFSALTLIFALLSLVLPVFSFVTVPLCAVPTVIVSVRHGFKYGILTAVVASFLVSVFVEPASALSLFFIILFLGLSQGIAIRKNYSIPAVVFVGLVGAAIAVILITILAYYLSGVNLFYEQIKIFKESIAAQEQLVLRYGLNKEDIAAQQRLLNQIVDSFSRIMPAVVVMISGWLSSLCGFISYQVLRRLGFKLSKVVNFKKLQMPWFFSWGYLIGLAASLFYKSFGGYSEVILTVGMNLLLVFGIIFFIQGLAVAFYFFEKYKLSFGGKMLFFIFAVFIQIMFQGLTWLGLFDTWFNYRKIPQEVC